MDIAIEFVNFVFLERIGLLRKFLLLVKFAVVGKIEGGRQNFWLFGASALISLEQGFVLELLRSDGGLTLRVTAGTFG